MKDLPICLFYEQMINLKYLDILKYFNLNKYFNKIKNNELIKILLIKKKNDYYIEKSDEWLLLYNNDLVISVRQAIIKENIFIIDCLVYSKDVSISQAIQYNANTGNILILEKLLQKKDDLKKQENNENENYYEYYRSALQISSIKGKISYFKRLLLEIKKEYFSKGISYIYTDYYNNISASASGIEIEMLIYLILEQKIAIEKNPNINFYKDYSIEIQSAKRKGHYVISDILENAMNDYKKNNLRK